MDNVGGISIHHPIELLIMTLLVVLVVILVVVIIVMVDGMILMCYQFIK